MWSDTLITIEIFIEILITLTGFYPEIFEGVVAFRGVVKLGSIKNVTQSATEHHTV